MTTLQQDIQAFQSLSYDQKKHIVLNMLEQLKDNNENFGYLHKKIHELATIDEELLLTIYQDILELAEKKKTSIKQLEMESYKKIHEKIEEIRKQEAAAIDEDADSLLAQL